MKSSGMRQITFFRKKDHILKKKEKQTLGKRKGKINGMKMWRSRLNNAFSRAFVGDDRHLPTCTLFLVYWRLIPKSSLTATRPDRKLTDLVPHH